MTPKEWAETWKRASSELEKVWLNDLRSLNTAEAILSFESAFNFARKTQPLRQSSGLVEMKRILLSQNK